MAHRTQAKGQLRHASREEKEELLPGMKNLLEADDPDIARLLRDALFPDDFAAIA